MEDISKNYQLLHVNCCDLALRGAILIKEATNRILKKQKSLVLGVCGGRSVAIIFDVLQSIDLEWKKIHIFMVDERIVPIENEQSNFSILNEHLLKPLRSKDNIVENNIHPFILDETKKDFGISRYEHELKQYGGVYDIILLSAGEDGHIAGIFPNHHSIHNDSNFFIEFQDSPKPPSHRMSASKSLIDTADTSILIFQGKGKKRALRNFTNKILKINDCPAKLIQSIKNSFVLTDQFKETI